MKSRGIKKPMAIFLVALCLVALWNCSGVDILNATIPRNGYGLRKDIAYGAQNRQKLDVYIPAQAHKDKCVVLFFYGGSWQTGDKGNYLFAGQAFSSIGCVAVVADYRRYPEVSFPVFVEDSAAALDWVQAHIAEYGGNPGNIYLAGHSAGAYNAMMVAARPPFFKKNAGVTPEGVKGVIALAGPYDFLPFTDPKIIALFSTAKDPDTQPINFVHKGMPPVFLATGDEDTEVSPKNSQRLDAKMKKLGNKSTLKIYPGRGHVGLVLSLAEGFRHLAPTLHDISLFIHKK